MTKVLCFSEQGSGDSLMMERYLTHVAAKSGEVPVVSVQPELVSWFKSRGHDAISNKDELPHCDYSIPMMSLPSIFGVIPPAEVVRKPIAHDRCRVGLCWQGNTLHANDHDRSLSPEYLKPLLALSGIEYVSLQYGGAIPDHKGLPFQPTDYAETARTIDTLDAVVSVDTSVCHLAGTLGVPTFTLLQCAPEWRWGLYSDKTKWYPSMTLVRRRDWKSWPEAIERVSELLTQMQKKEAT